MSKYAEDFIKSLPWSASATNDEKALVEGNLRNFAAAYTDMLATSLASLTREGGYNYDDAQWRKAFSDGIEAAIEFVRGA